MSITMRQPALVINSDDVPWPNYHMWDTWNAPPGIRVTDVVNRIIASGTRTPTGVKVLQNVILNCHGDPGSLYIGGLDFPPITLADLGAFSKIYREGKVDVITIWLVACNAARNAIGKQFCAKLARECQCNVVAADDYQEVETSYWLFSHNVFTIDDFEGNVFLFDGLAGTMIPYDPDADTNDASMPHVGSVGDDI